jgi:phage terminase small subunit
MNLLPMWLPMEGPMPEQARKAMRDATRQKRSTVGKRSGAGQRSRQIPPLLEDPREDRFATFYVENPNGTQAAIAAGYSPKSAHTIAHRLLKRSNIKDAIARRNAELMVRYNFTPDRIIRELAKIAGVNIADYLNAERTGVDLTKATRDQLAAIASVEAGELGLKIKLADKLKALTELAKLARLYPVDRAEISGVVEHQHRIDIEVLDNEKREQLRSVLLALKAKQVEAEAQPGAG